MTCYFYRRCFRTAVLGFGMLSLVAFVSAQESRTDDGAGIEVLASGPVHEAFAEPIVFDPKPGMMVPTNPPPQVEELPPDQRPAGDNIAWIPGYWSWDEDRENYLWVSGFWRTLPPGREWVPGYWVEVTGGWQWVSGFWANAADEVTEYLPEPPQTIETGPSTPQPGPDYFWVPGCWYWRSASYVWRPGYWIVSQPNWIWSPAHYVWSPRGFVFVGGYWDYALPRRGMLFAPVYFNSPFYAQPGYRFSPTIAVNVAVLTNHFFVGLGQRHYYFGDYYAPHYADSGMYPWFAFASSRHGYDPIYSHYHNQFGRTDRNWANRVRSDYEFRRDNENARPERVASRNPRIVRQDGQRADGDRPLVQPLSQFAAAQDTQGAMVKLQEQQRTQIAKVAQQTREFTQQRMKTETDPNSSLLAPGNQSKKAERPDGKKTVEEANKDLRSATVKRPKSPIADVPKVDVSKPDQKVQPTVPDKDLPAVPKAAPKVEPKRPAQEKPLVPKVDPKPSTKEPVPKVEPKPPVKPPAPRVEPPKPAVPKVEPPKVQPEPPKVQPTPPKVQPAPPKVQPAPPKVQPAPPKVQPAPPKVQPAPPKTEPPPKIRPEVPKVAPPPKVRPEVPKVEPKPKLAPPLGG